MKWQSIDSAPRDGKPVLLYQPEEGGCILNDKYDRDDYTFVGFCEDGRWFCSEYTAFEKTPTHWMELPESPNA